MFRVEDHDGLDGITLGEPGAAYHFECTRANAHRAGKAGAQDNLLVVYFDDEAAWTGAVERMRAAGFEPVPSLKTYWARVGLTFKDPDGYRVVLQRAAWER